MELIEYITDLLVDFDEMGFAPTTTCPNPEAYAIEWRNKITKAFEELTEEKEKLGFLIDEIVREKRELFEENKWLTEENERLREKADRNLENLKAVLEERNENTIVADTVKEMKERVKERIADMEYNANIQRKTVSKEELLEQVNWVFHEVVPNTIDQIAKEMMENG
jgi:ATP phosphoribosyltransferase